jgi:hypothetical protein
VRLGFLASLAVALAMSMAAAAFAQTPAAAADGYKMCLDSNAQIRKSLAAAPGMPQASRQFATLVIDDRICECIKSQEAEPSAAQRDPMMRFMGANSVCLARHVNDEFPAACPALYRNLLPVMGYAAGTAAQINEVCACATDVMKHSLTAEALLQAQLEQYRYFRALVADRQNHTNTASAVRPGPGAFERGMQGLRTCAITVLGAPAKVAQ